MANYSFFSVVAIGLLLSFVVAGVESVGVCYGMNGNNLPPPNEVIGMFKSNRIDGIRMYDTNPNVLQALRGSNIPVTVDVSNSDIGSLASDPSAASRWLQNNIQPFAQDVAFRYISVGNELIPGSAPQNVLPAMQNMQNALNSAGLRDKIKVSTSVSTGVFGNSYPPSAGSFSANVLPTLQPIVAFLAANGAPLLANVYPYFSYIENPNSIPLQYALFTSPGTVVTDGNLQYQNLFDAMIDALYSALEKAGGPGVRIVVSETGWPSDGGFGASQANAQAYITNLMNHVGHGTPKRPWGIETYLFAMFDENQKQPQGTENHYGLFYPNKQPKFPLNF